MRIESATRIAYNSVHCSLCVYPLGRRVRSSGSLCPPLAPLIASVNVVLGLYETIVKDTRHCEATMIASESIQNRQFDTWMAVQYQSGAKLALEHRR